MARTNRGTVSWTLSLLDLQRSHDVLEIGFGPGVGIQMAADRAREGTVTGIDPSEAMLETATERTRALLDAGRAQLVTGVAERLPWEEATFDRAFTVNTFQVLHDPDQALAELHRVLAPGGRVAVAFSARRRGHADGVADQLTRAGFKHARRLTSEHGTCVVATR